LLGVIDIFKERIKYMGCVWLTSILCTNKQCGEYNQPVAYNTLENCTPEKCKFYKEEDMDERIAYGVGCTRWDSVGKVAVSKKSGLPVCPHCGGLLMEAKNEKEWFDCADVYEKGGHRGYRKFMEWMRGKCFKSMEDASLIYESETGELVII
jgi:hypothetical protein